MTFKRNLKVTEYFMYTVSRLHMAVYTAYHGHTRGDHKKTSPSTVPRLQLKLNSLLHTCITILHRARLIKNCDCLVWLMSTNLKGKHTCTLIPHHEHNYSKPSVADPGGGGGAQGARAPRPKKYVKISPKFTHNVLKNKDVAPPPPTKKNY